MSESLDVEYCAYCEDIYALRAPVWLCFGDDSAETTRAEDYTFNCPRCDNLIERYSGYLDALVRCSDIPLVDDLLRCATDLSIEAKKVLRNVLPNIGVPSFSVYTTGSDDECIDELVKKRYIEIIKTDDLTLLTVNAHKLGLLDNEPLLKEMVHQSSFLSSPSYLKTDRKHSVRRFKRIASLVDDFSDDDRTGMLNRFNGRCALTGKGVNLHIDHVIPVSSGHGGTTLSNMLPIWQRINSSKGAKNIFEWYEENGDRFEVLPELFDQAIEYLAKLNGMTTKEYRDYVYVCHANPIDYLTEASK